MTSRKNIREIVSAEIHNALTRVITPRDELRRLVKAWVVEDVSALTAAVRELAADLKAIETARAAQFDVYRLTLDRPAKPPRKPKPNPKGTPFPAPLDH